jgi:lysophospholipase L1-like esterase
VDPTSRRNQVLGRIGLVLGAVVVGLLGAEVIARLAWREPARSPLAQEGTLPVLDDFWDLVRPNVRGINRGVLYRSNSRGLRGPEWSPEPAAGVFRIAIAGDSTTMGSGVEEEDRYSSQLERLLNERDSGRRYEVMNTGLNGLNIDHGVQRLERMMAHYRAHLFVFGFSRNDIEGPAYKEAEGYEEVAEWWLWAQRNARSSSYFWRLLSYRIVDFHTRSNRVRKNQEIRDNYLENPAAWAAFLGGLDRFAALAREHGVCAHVLLHTHLDNLGPDHPYLDIYERVQNAAIERGISVTASFPYFEGRRPVPLWVSLFDPHPNRDGHEILARALSDGLAELPPSCWSIGGDGAE